MRKALVVGINNYPQCPLSGCENDAEEIEKLLEQNENNSKNFDVCIENNISTKGQLRKKIRQLFNGDNEIELFYFSGHGFVNELGGYIVTPDFSPDDWGISMNDILKYANDSKSKNKIIILDCCYSGAMGNMTINDSISSIGNGVTILTASRDSETSMEIGGHGVFTQLLIEALKGGASNLQGKITPGSVYAYIDQALGAWEQRPIFKTNISRFISIRNANPRVKKEEISIILKCFCNKKDEFYLDPSFEFTNNPQDNHTVIEPYSIDKNVEIFKVLQKLESVDLIEPVDEKHMYFAAMNSKSCRLTSLGQYYWQLLKENRI